MSPHRPTRPRPLGSLGSGSLALLGLAGGATVLAGQAWATARSEFLRRADYDVAHVADPSGAVRAVTSGRGVAAARIAVLGDSTVEGVGAPSPEGALPAHLARAVAERLGAPIAVTGFGVAGARTADVAGDQASRLAVVGRDGRGWDVAVVVVGSNDATHALPPWRMRRLTRDALAATRETAGAEVVLGGIPEFHTVPAVPPPLRRVLGWHADLLRSRQRAGARDLGVPFVDIRAEASPRFLGRPETMSPDGFHPSSEGYRLWADALAATVYAIVTSSLR